MNLNLNTENASSFLLESQDPAEVSCESFATEGTRSVRSQAIAEELQSVMGDVESFLSQWLHKIQDELSTMDSTMGDATVRRRYQALQEEKKRWEAKRQRELEEIEQKASQLTNAWLNLESEQRQLLQQQERRGQRRDSSPTPAPPLQATASEIPVESTRVAPALTASVSSSPAPSDTGVGAASAAAVAPVATAPAAGPARRPSHGVPTRPRSGGPLRTFNDAVRQFEQLRREIEFTRAST